MNDVDDLLGELRDIQPPDVSGLPAPGWWVLAAIGLLAAWLVYRLYRSYRSRAWQREARAELEQLRSQLAEAPVSAVLTGTSRLVRRVVLAARPREQVASLQGEAWLDELDGICGKPLFRSGFGKLLELGPYQPHPELEDTDLHALMDVVEQLIDAAGRRTSGGSSA